MAKIKKNFKGSATYWKLKAVLGKCKNFKQLVGAKNILARFKGSAEEWKSLHDLSDEMDARYNPYISTISLQDEIEGEMSRKLMRLGRSARA